MITSESTLGFIQDVIWEKANAGFFRNKDTVIFGCNSYARDIRDILRAKGIEISACLDRDPGKQEKLFLKAPVCQPEEYLKDKKEVAVIIYSGYGREMAEQLEKMGYRLGREILYIPFNGDRKPPGDTIEEADRAMERVFDGYEVYRSRKRLYAEAEMVFVCPYKGTGDVYMACSFLKRYLEKKNIRNFLVLVPGNSCRRVANLFGISDVEVISEEEMGEVLDAWVFLGDEAMNVKPLLHWGWRTKNTPYIFNNKRTSFADMFRYDVFGLDDHTEMEAPFIDRNSDYAERLFSSMGLPKGKTVVLAPYTNSCRSEITAELWERMAEGLKRKGYGVCTNCAGEEKPIRNTQAICFPYEEGVNVAEYAGGFLAFRSGLCEIVSPAKCKMVVFYENGSWSTSYEHFSLRKMGLNQNEIPVIFEKDEDIEKIFEIFS